MQLCRYLDFSTLIINVCCSRPPTLWLFLKSSNRKLIHTWIGFSTLCYQIGHRIMKRSSYLSYICQLYIFKGEHFLLLRIMGNGREILMRHYVKGKWRLITMILINIERLLCARHPVSHFACAVLVVACSDFIGSMYHFLLTCSTKQHSKSSGEKLWSRKVR